MQPSVNCRQLFRVIKHKEVTRAKKNCFTQRTIWSKYFNLLIISMYMLLYIFASCIRFADRDPKCQQI